MLKIANFLVKADVVCDYIPVLSSATNLIDLFQKTIVLPKLSAEEIANNHYYTHLRDKEVSRCLTLLLPFLGNMIVAISDFRLEPLVIEYLEEVKKEIEESRKIIMAKTKHFRKPENYAFYQK